MKQKIEQLIHATRLAFLSSTFDKSRFYDLTLSLVAWKVFSTQTAKTGWNYNIDVVSPGAAYDFDRVMRHIGEPDHKERASRSLQAWEAANQATLAELIAVEPDLIQGIPQSAWNLICVSWTDLFATQQSENITLKALMVSVMDGLELSLSDDRIIFENYAPQELVGLMVDLLSSSPGSSLYDPYAWSGSFLSAAAQHLRGLSHIRGFAAAGLPWKLAKLRLLLLSTTAELRIEKGLDHYKLSDEARFDLILMNPPYGRRENSQAVSTEPGPWSHLAGSSNRIDLALVCHSLNRLSPTGSAAILLPGIFLSGQGALLEFRCRVIQNNLLDAVITLPSGVFPQTGVSTNILVFNKKRATDKVFMLDASHLVQKSINQVVLDEAAIHRYLIRYREGTLTPDEHCLLVSNNHITKMGHDLKFSTYVPSEQQLINPFPSSVSLFEESSRLFAEYQQTQEKIKQLTQSKK
ncbi:MAG TPA: N-6 DNA methylase [Puia sp.]|uniref:HsdM family class I SAM-dependent methyltransferase n=1 Tax=Puia sp. TaxID=2045100 RepID=UPI002BB067E3|nr:N-6 DNA methylase [Puia sp.]HVU94847.1 N-6 DNA methylase [Puia sp.]